MICSHPVDTGDDAARSSIRSAVEHAHGIHRHTLRHSNTRSADCSGHMSPMPMATFGAVSIRDLSAAAEKAASSGQATSIFLSHILFDLEIAFAETRACLLIARQGMSESA